VCPKASWASLICHTRQYFRRRRLDTGCQYSMEPVRGRWRQLWGKRLIGEEASFETKMEDAVRHMSNQSSIRGWRWTAAWCNWLAKKEEDCSTSEVLHIERTSLWSWDDARGCRRVTEEEERGVQPTSQCPATCLVLDGCCKSSREWCRRIFKCERCWRPTCTETQCYSEPCQNGGQCHELYRLGKFVCKCARGYEGETCEKGSFTSYRNRITLSLHFRLVTYLFRSASHLVYHLVTWYHWTAFPGFRNSFLIFEALHFYLISYLLIFRCWPVQ